MTAISYLRLLSFLNYSVQWPKGSYTLVKPKAGCPTGWYEGWRKQDNEDKNNKNELSSGHHFCGFQTGSIYWDDEDKNNSNEKDATLPSGEFDKDTLIDYCCRSDGSYNTKIILPTDKPFYLLRFFTSSPCQQVKGMIAREEIIKTDDEDNNNKNSNSGSHPRIVETTTTSSTTAIIIDLFHKI
ncbi:unnamed protein product [Mytilus edulis]|uniref:Apextrin C-terminal domain-containing protein n=1 Tax=Mytilus edulis TaxID=6550 RepID=A0A8S3PLX0_MYTED|nr:unnamed protein product [Mytilus edulis]